MDWNKELADHLHEELADSMKYAEMAKMATDGDRQMLRDMAWEEYNHARHVKHMLCEHNIMPACDTHAIFEKARQELVTI